MFFACASIFGILVGNEALIAQIKNIYSDDSDQIAGLNSLMSAVAANDISGVRFFSKAGPSLINQRNIGGATALHIAAREKNLEITQMLIDNGADVNIADNEGWTPLMRASLAGADDVVDLLLSKNVDATALNLVNESAIIHASTSNCSACLSSMFEKFNFIKFMPDAALKTQLNDAYVIARNHENEEIQGILDKYLDQIVKLAMLVKPQEITEDLGNISIVEENKLNLVTKNKPAGNFEEKDLAADGSLISKKQIGRIKGKFKFAGEYSNGQTVDADTAYISNDEKTNQPKNSKSQITDKKNKFILISKSGQGDLPQTKSASDSVKIFKPSDSNAVFLLNSKVDNKSVTDVLKSKKFKFAQGPKSLPQEATEAETKIEKKVEESAPIPPIVNSFKLLKGPKGDDVKKEDKAEAEQVGNTSNSSDQEKIAPVKEDKIANSDQPEIIMLVKKPKKDKAFKFANGFTISKVTEKTSANDVNSPVEKIVPLTAPTQKKKGFKLAKDSASAEETPTKIINTNPSSEPKMDFKFSQGPSTKN